VGGVAGVPLGRQPEHIATLSLACLLAVLVLGIPWPPGLPIPDESVQALERLLAARERALVQSHEASGVPLYQLAAIVAGEASVIPEARLAVACTVLRDWRVGRSLAARWYGWSEPRSADFAAVEQAVSGACWRYPYFRFVGSRADWETWQRLGWVEGDPPWVWRRGRWMLVATE